MQPHVTILQGHPDGANRHLCHALADAYAQGAQTAGASVGRLDVATLAPEPLCDPADFATQPGDAMQAAQAEVLRCRHLVVIFPIWLGTMPALLKAFFEQLARAEFALGTSTQSTWPQQKLKGRSAHVIATMGMPALAYRYLFWNRGVGNLKHLILGLSGIKPVRQTLIGGVDTLSEEGGANWLRKIEAAGQALK